MTMVCNGCGDWVKPLVEPEAEAVRCPECGHVEAMRILPLFIVTGASGTGKTAVAAELRPLLPDWEVFETDILWDSGGDWRMVKCNWLRIAHSIAQSGRATLLCGTILPGDIAACEQRAFFRSVHFLNLHCDDITRAARLRARPPWRGCTEDFIAAQQQFAHWLLSNAETAFYPPLTTLDTTGLPVSAVAARIHDWALRHWEQKGDRE